MIAAGEHPSATVNALGLIWPLSALGTALALRTSTDQFATPVPALVPVWRADPRTHRVNHVNVRWEPYADPVATEPRSIDCKRSATGGGWSGSCHRGASP
jgi:hypothetical protein